MNAITTLPVGFKYLIEVVNKDGEVTDSEIVDNLMPLQGLNHMLGVVLKGSSQFASWYIGLYKGAYTPNANDTAANISANAVESSGYGSNRLPFVGSTVSGGVCDNHDNKAEFTMTSAETIYGGFLVSAQSVGSTAGVLLSVVRFSSPKVLDVGSILRVTAGISLVSTS